MLSHLTLLCAVGLVAADTCYWNNHCPYQLYSSKTPYDVIRGDIRDYAIPDNCEAVSIWTLNRHGNRNPGSSVTASIKHIADFKDEIITSYENGRSQLCAQDIEEFKKWRWNETLEVSQSFLTGTGYEELYDIAKRLNAKYPHLLNGSADDYYFRPTNEQRTITSAMAFAHGWSDGTNLSLSIDSARDRDDVIRPYQNCDRYQQDVKGSATLEENLDAYYRTAEYIAIQNAVQKRLGISKQLTADNIYEFYEICRFYRSWEPNLRSPWCAVFSDADLVVLEYRDDVRHYYRNGYGSWVNARLGELPMKDLYESFQAAAQGQGKKLMSHFTHDTMMEMVYCALDIFKDNNPLQGSRRDNSRLWRTSHIAEFSANLIAVLNSCVESGVPSNRVQIFINEKVTDLCPLEGCTWQEFTDKFQPFVTSNLEFCSMDYVPPVADDATVPRSILGWIFLTKIVTFRFWW